MTIYPVGTMVRVRDDALKPDAKNGDTNMDIVRRHGYIWFVQQSGKTKPIMYLCRSMATEASGIIFFGWELETHEEIADA